MIPKEYPHVSCRSLDVDAAADRGARRRRDSTAQLLAEIETATTRRRSPARNNIRWVRDFEPLRLEASTRERAPLREGGVYLITGGTGGIGLTFAGYLAVETRRRARLLDR